MNEEILKWLQGNEWVEVEEMVEPNEYDRWDDQRIFSSNVYNKFCSGISSILRKFPFTMWNCKRKWLELSQYPHPTVLGRLDNL